MYNIDKSITLFDFINKKDENIVQIVNEFKDNFFM